MNLQHEGPNWDKIWTYGEARRERVFLDGSDGEIEFDRDLQRKTVGKVVLDISCGSGRFKDWEKGETCSSRWLFWNPIVARVDADIHEDRHFWANWTLFTHGTRG